MPATKQAPPTRSATDEAHAPADEGSEDATDQQDQQESEPDPTEDMPMQVRCPLCGDSFERPQALHGHLRFSHDLRDDELDEVYERAQSDEYVDFPEEESDESGGDGDTSSRPVSEGKEEADLKAEEGAAVARAFDWESRLEHMEGLRSELKRLDRSRQPNGLEAFFGKTGTRDEGIQECLDALDEMEIEVRERLGMSTVDRELQRRVDQTLDKIGELIRCREQREALEEKFSDRQGTPDRIGRLDGKEVEIRKHVRDLWDAGKPTEELDEEDPVVAGDSSSQK